MCVQDVESSSLFEVFGLKQVRKFKEADRLEELLNTLREKGFCLP